MLKYCLSGQDQWVVSVLHLINGENTWSQGFQLCSSIFHIALKEYRLMEYRCQCDSGHRKRTIFGLVNDNPALKTTSCHSGEVSKYYRFLAFRPESLHGIYSNKSMGESAWSWRFQVCNSTFLIALKEGGSAWLVICNFWRYKLSPVTWVSSPQVITLNQDVARINSWNLRDLQKGSA